MEEPIVPDKAADGGIEQTLQLILNRLDRFPAERFVRMEAELQQLRAMLEEESESRKALTEQMHQMAREFQETVDKKMDRAFGDCRQDRDLRLARFADRLDSMQEREREERSMNVKLKLALLSAACAFVISMINAIISLLSRH
jgi:hypothetical protein